MFIKLLSHTRAHFSLFSLNPSIRSCYFLRHWDGNYHAVEWEDGRQKHSSGPWPPASQASFSVKHAVQDRVGLPVPPELRKIISGSEGFWMSGNWHIGRSLTTWLQITGRLWHATQPSSVNHISIPANISKPHNSVKTPPQGYIPQNPSCAHRAGSRSTAGDMSKCHHERLWAPDWFVVRLV